MYVNGNYLVYDGSYNYMSCNSFRNLYGYCCRFWANASLSEVLPLTSLIMSYDVIPFFSNVSSLVL